VSAVLDSATIAELAARAAEYRRRSKAGAVRKGRKQKSEYRVSEEKRRRIVELYEDGYNYAEIARIVGVSKATISRVVKREGVVRKQHVARVVGYSRQSVAVIIPIEYVRKLGLRVGDRLIIRLDGNALVITPADESD